MFPWQRLRRKPIVCRVVLALLVGLSVTFMFWNTMNDGPNTARSMSSTPVSSNEDLPAAISVGTRTFKEFISHRPNQFSSNALRRKQSQPGRKGVLNLHLWDEICGNSLRILRNFPLFPNMPAKRRVVTLPIQRLGAHYGVRIFGFLVPPETGTYELKVVSSGSAELWLSSSGDPRDSKLICQTIQEPISVVYHSPIKTVPLEKNKTYYVEALHKHGDGGNFVFDYFTVRWKTSSDELDFSDIPPRNFRSFQDDSKYFDYDVASDSFPWARLPMHEKDRIPARDNTDSRIRSFNLPFFKDEAGDVLFEKRRYSPSYTIKDSQLQRYGAVWETHYTSVFPRKNSHMKSHTGFISLGNDELEEAVAKKVVGMVSAQLKRKYKGQYTVKRILNVEQNRDPEEGERYLVELEVQDTTKMERLRFSEYLFKPRGFSQLYYPENVEWNKSAMVNIIVTCGGNQVRWVHHFINNMDHIYRITNDSNFNVIIVDFHNSVAELKAALERSQIPNYMLLQNKGKFHKTLGIENGANMVTDPDAIVFVMDLHLDIPANLLDEIRKHCIKGHITYGPLLARLDCGAMAHAPAGFWEVEGYGLIGMYKSDWNKFGGMNIDEFKHSWGGEDWEMADRILMAGLEIERLKVPHLYHYHHSKKGMWDDAH